MTTWKQWHKRFTLVGLVAVLYTSLMSPLNPFILKVLAADYDFVLQSFSQPTLEAGQEQQVELSLLNSGELEWDKEQVKLGYHWTNSEGNRTDGPTSALDETIPPTALTPVTQKILLQAPATPGEYKLQLDLFTDVYLNLDTPEVLFNIQAQLAPAPEVELTLKSVSQPSYEREIKFEITTNSVRPVTQMRFTVGDIETATWQDFTPTTTLELPANSGNYTIKAQVRNDQGTVSEVATAMVDYQHTQINLELTAAFLDGTILGGNGILNINVKNTGTDTAYAGSLELQLPPGIEFVSSLAGKDEIAPTHASSAAVQWEKFITLAAGNEFNLAIEVKISPNSQASVGTNLEFPVKFTAYRDSALQHAINSTKSAELLIVPLQVSGTKKTNLLVGAANHQATVNLQIQNNSGVNATAPTQVVVNLPSGVEFIPGSQKTAGLAGNLGDPAIETAADGTATLHWTLPALTTAQYATPINISYKVGLPTHRRTGYNLAGDVYFDNDGQIIRHGDSFGIQTQVITSYDPEALIEIKLATTSTIVAKYLTLTKHADKSIVQPGDVVTFTISLAASSAFNLASIYISDLLPDGIDLIDSEVALASGFPKVQNGKTLLQWAIANMDAGSSFSFSYRGLVTSEYATGKPVLSADSLASVAKVEAVFGDNDGEGDSGDLEDESPVAPEIKRPVLTTLVQNPVTGAWEPKQLVTIGDVVRTELKLKFPEAPTSKASLQHYYFNNLELRNTESTVVNNPDLFSGDPTNGLPFLTLGRIFNLGDVKPGAEWTRTVEYTVGDSAQNSDGDTLRDLAQLAYTNSHGKQILQYAQAAVTIVEPQISVSKKLVSGYLASSQTVQVETTIRNFGGSTAYQLNLTDLGIAHTILDQDSIQVVGGDCDINKEAAKIELFNCVLGSKQAIVISFAAKVNSGIVTNTPMPANVEIISFANRPANATALTRHYPARTHQFNWQGVEGALVTTINILNAQSQQLPGFSRQEQVMVHYKITNVGGAPIYNAAAHITEFNADGYLTIGDSNSNGTCTADLECKLQTLLPGDSLYFTRVVTVAVDTPFGRTYAAKIAGSGQDIAGNAIRKFAQAELAADTDDDDLIEEDLTVVRTDLTAPHGSISFTNQQGEQITATNSPTITINYQAQDTGKGIRWARFTTDPDTALGQANNWYTLTELATTNSCANWSGACNLWDGAKLPVQITLPSQEQRNFYWVQVMDVDENIALIEGSVVLDTTAPTNAAVRIGHAAGDVTNPSFTNSLTNWVTYTANDNAAGVQAIRLSHDKLNWGNWIAYKSEAVNTHQYVWPSASTTGALTIYLEVRDAAGNISAVVSDNISIDNTIPTAQLQINAGAAFTGTSLVNLQLNATDTVGQVTHMRSAYCASDTAQCLAALSDPNFDPDVYPYAYLSDWATYQQHFVDALSDKRADGIKTICTEVRDEAQNISLPTCDTITHDTTAPAGTVVINGGLPYTASAQVNLQLTGSDQLNSDSSAGSGAVEFSVSNNGIDWSDWKILPHSPHTQAHQLAHAIGLNYVYVRYRDSVGNVSQTFSDNISVNPFVSSGAVKINDDATFTDTTEVRLQLAPQGTPTYMKIWNQYADSSLVTLEKYQKVKHWQLPEGEFGTRRVYAQFYYNGAAETPVFDEIILAPRYAITYSTGSAGHNNYTLSSIPAVLDPDQDIQVVLDVYNSGSLVWEQFTENGSAHPVNIGYHWYRQDGSIYQYEAQRGLLPYAVAYQQGATGITLTVTTPSIPGIYTLEFDAVHEGVTWFSAMGNAGPRFQINVGNVSTGQSTDVLGSSDINLPQGIAYYTVQQPTYDPNWRCAGHDCLTAIAEQFYQCSAKGIPNDVPPNVYVYNEHLLKDKCWYPIYKQNQHLWDGQNIPWQYWQQPWNFILPGWQLVIPNVPDTWNAQLLNQSHAGKIIIKQGTSVQATVQYQNVGTAVWLKPETKLATVDPRNRSSLFSTSWLTANRTSTYAENATSGILPAGVATFAFSFTAPDNLTPGVYRECFGPIADGKGWMDQNPACWDITVISRMVPIGKIFCDEGTNVYDAINGNIVDHLPFNSTVTILEEQGDWLRVNIGGNNQLWITSDCFDQTGEVENPEDSSADSSYDQPTGDKGVIISAVGVKVRYGPSLKFNYFAEIPFGTTVRVLRQTKSADIADGLGNWYEIELADGRRGWVPAGFVDLAPGYEPPIWTPPKPKFDSAHTCNASGIHLKAGPNWDSRTYRILVSHINFRIVDVVGDWYYAVLTSGTSGFIHQTQTCEGYYFPPVAADSHYYDGKDWVRPYTGYYPVTSGFGPRWGTFHNGTDYGMACGTDLRAVEAGTVSRVGKNGIVLGNQSNETTPANFVIIDHGNGWSSYYWHLRYVAVNTGERIERGQFIGRSGNTGFVKGSASLPVDQQGCHLHLEIRKNGVPVDPELIFGQPPRQVPQPGPGGNQPTVPAESGYQPGVPGATPQTPYAGKKGNEREWPELKVNRYIATDGSNKWNELGEARKHFAPQITLVATSDNGKQTTIYGVGLPKNFPVHVDLKNEYRYCWQCGSTTEDKYQQLTAQHVKLALFKPDWTYLGEVWNDRADGRWQLTLPLGTTLKPGDEVIAETQIYADYWFNGIRWWSNTYENALIDVEQIFKDKRGVWYWGSGASNRVRVPQQKITDPAEAAIRAREHQLGNVQRSGGLTQLCGQTAQKYTKIGNHDDSIVVYNPDQKTAYLITGGILFSFQTYGACGEFGLPTADESTTGRTPGWFQNFTKANIYWADKLPKSQPGIVRGKIRDYYESLGGTWHELGFPEGQQWSETSFCGTSGTMQHFQSGRVYSSTYGQYYVNYDGWFDFQTQKGIGGPNGTGWPQGRPYQVSGTQWIWQFERGTINWNLNQWFTPKSGCGNADQRQFDPAPNAAVRAIYQKEDLEFREFKRTDAGQGNGAIHSWQCGGQTLWVVDYDTVAYHTGTKLDYTTVLYNPDHNRAYALSGKTREHYFNTGGCTAHGLPLQDVVLNTRPSKNDQAVVDWQAFGNSTLVYHHYSDWHFSNTGPFRGTMYSVSGKFNHVYSSPTHLMADSDKTYIHGYIGIPISESKVFKEIKIKDEVIKDVLGVEFQAGYIVYDNQKGEYRKILSEAALNKLQADITGQDGSEGIKKFIEGFGEGIKSAFAIETAVDLASMLLEVAGKLATGPIGTFVIVGSLILGAIQVIQAIAEIGPQLGELISDPNARAFIGGALLGGVLAGALTGRIDDAVAGALSKLRKLADVSKVLGKMNLPGNIKSVIQKFSQSAQHVGEVGPIKDILQKYPILTNCALAGSNADLSGTMAACPLTGVLDALEPQDVKKALILATRRNINIGEWEPYLKFITNNAELIYDLPELDLDLLLKTIKKGTTVDLQDFANDLAVLKKVGAKHTMSGFELEYKGKNHWVSPERLEYKGLDPDNTERIAHSFKHMQNDVLRDDHGVFTLPEVDLLTKTDRAYAILKSGDKSKIREIVQSGTHRKAFLIDLSEEVGYLGGKNGLKYGNPTTTWVRIVVEDGNKLITVFPDSPKYTKNIPI